MTISNPLPPSRMQTSIIEPVTKYTFTIRIKHSHFVNGIPNQILSSRDMKQKSAFISISLSTRSYLNDVVLYDDEEQSLISFCKLLIGDSNYQKLIPNETDLVNDQSSELEISQDPETNQRYLTIDLLNQGISRKAVCQAIGFTMNQLKYIQKLVAKGEIVRSKRKSKCNQGWYDEISIFLSHPLKQHSSLAEIRKHICQALDRTQAAISLKSVGNMVKKIGFSYKRSRAGVIQRNSDAVIESRKRKSFELLALLKQGKKIIYVDETGFHRGIIPIHGYSKIGEPLIFSRKSLSTNFTAIAAISHHKIIGYQIFQGGVKAESFASFLISLLDSNPAIRHNLDDWVFIWIMLPSIKPRSLNRF